LVCLFLLVFVGGCVHKDAVYEPTYAGQGGVTLKEQAVEPRPARVVAPAGPTAREIELQRRVDELEAKAKAGETATPAKAPDDRQRRIDELEAKSRALQNESKELQAEIERLKREK
jgi:hypothetical protein